MSKLCNLNLGKIKLDPRVIAKTKALNDKNLEYFENLDYFSDDHAEEYLMGIEVFAH